ncbi:MAG: hypothetical protein ACLFSM_08335 [Thermoplasmata archaeon]
MNKKILIPGIAVVIVGILLIALGITGVIGPGMVEETEISNIQRKEEDYTFVYENYSEGDMIVVTGEISRKEEDPNMSELDFEYDYGYELEDEGETLSFLSNKDIGDTGDEVTVTLEVNKEEAEFFGETATFEYMVLEQEGEPLSIMGIPLIGLLGIIIAIVGVIITVVGVAKEEELYDEPGPSAYAGQTVAQRDPYEKQGFQQTQQEPRQELQQNLCPDCGQPIRYIEEYDSWYCDSCKEYK